MSDKPSPPSDKTQSNPAPTPDCPKWAADLLDKLHRIEVKLGNIQDVGTATGDPKKDGWHTRSLDDLVTAAHNKANKKSGDGSENDSGEDSDDTSGADGTPQLPDDDGTADLAEAIFDRVCAGLSEDGFDAGQIAAIVNSKVGKGSRMKYCNASDVSEALKA
jgi:hypothetical protein